jgi:hypothetical protein
VDVSAVDALRALERTGIVAVLNADGTLRGLLGAGEPAPSAALASVTAAELPLTDSSSMAEAIDLLLQRRARFIPVTGGDQRFEGIIADLDVLRWAARVRAGRLAGTARAHDREGSPPEETMNPPTDLLRPEAYPRPRPQAVELVETHISWVFLADGAVFKVKKPVDLGYVDFRTIEQRRDACEAEVRLNTRLAPGIYQGVVAVHCGRDRQCTLVGDGPIVDWAVHMVRLPDAERADVLLSHGGLSVADVDRIAKRIAAFHSVAARDEKTARFATTEAIERNVAENFAQLRDRIDRYVDPSQAEELARWQLAFVCGHDGLFRRRIETGRARDGHGDLRLEHVYLPDAGAPIVLDCIEFSDRFRYADVCADIAFLSMDLASHGRVDLAERLLATYARESGDFDIYPLVDFYESYRACVRAKISALVADDEQVDPLARQHAETDARRYLLLALSAERRPLVAPALFVVGGLIASGKSTVAARMSLEYGAPVVDADRTRKLMLGVEPSQPIHDEACEGAYDPAFTEKVYAEILRRAEQVLASGRCVIVDASFRSRASRAAAQDLAGRCHVPFRFIECRADEATTRARLVTRAREQAVSDGRSELFDTFRANFEPVMELAPDDHVVLDTTGSLDEVMAALRARVDIPPSV